MVRKRLESVTRIFFLFLTLIIYTAALISPVIPLVGERQSIIKKKTSAFIYLLVRKRNPCCHPSEVCSASPGPLGNVGWLFVPAGFESKHFLWDLWSVNILSLYSNISSHTFLYSLRFAPSFFFIAFLCPLNFCSILS